MQLQTEAFEADLQWRGERAARQAAEARLAAALYGRNSSADAATQTAGGGAPVLATRAPPPVATRAMCHAVMQTTPFPVVCAVPRREMASAHPLADGESPTGDQQLSPMLPSREVSKCDEGTPEWLMRARDDLEAGTAAASTTPRPSRIPVPRSATPRRRESVAPTSCTPPLHAASPVDPPSRVGTSTSWVAAPASPAAATASPVAAAASPVAAAAFEGGDTTRLVVRDTSTNEALALSPGRLCTALREVHRVREEAMAARIAELEFLLEGVFDVFPEIRASAARGVV